MVFGPDVVFLVLQNKGDTVRRDLLPLKESSSVGDPTGPTSLSKLMHIPIVTQIRNTMGSVCKFIVG